MKKTIKYLLIFLAIATLIFCTYGCKKDDCDNIRLVTKVLETDSVMMIQELGVKCDQEKEFYLSVYESHYDSLNSRTVIKYGEVSNGR